MSVPQGMQRDSFCPRCNSVNVVFDLSYGFYKCNDCYNCWSYAEDDPDLGELDNTIICPRCHGGGCKHCFWEGFRERDGF